MIRTLVLLGMTGDLARRFLVPALGALVRAGQLPDGFRVIGAARGTLQEADLRALAGNDLPAQMLTYHAVDLADPSSLVPVLDGADEPVAAYLALPPGIFATTIESLGEAGLPPGSRVVLEKPFGEDLESARMLNALLQRTSFDAYRVDHVLGMETTRNLVTMRRENAFLERLWTGDAVETVEILWEETLALEGRAGYYEHAGALKDVLQSHMLQLLALVGREGGESHEGNLAVLRSVRVTGSRRARYTAGTLADGREVPAYVEEEGVDPERCTETLAEVTLQLDDERWSDTTFVLRAGKALSRRRKLVLLRFRRGGGLQIGIDGPTDVVLQFAGRDRRDLCGEAAGTGLPPYAHVLLDVLGGTNELSVGGDEAEEAWRVVAPVLRAWENGEVPLEEYSAGSEGLDHAVARTLPTKTP